MTTPQKVSINQTSFSYKPKMIIPVEVENKIRLACIQSWNTEWSGVLFFTYSGSFKDKNLVVKCKDVYIMDVGNSTYTEFDMNPDVISYMTEHTELLDCQMGLIHSHNTMATFFSETDINTLKEEGNDRNNFVSLIVNNEGTYTAAITRKVKEKTIKQEINYEFFDQSTQKENKKEETETEYLEWFYFEIDKAESNYFSNEITRRFKEVRDRKEQQKKSSKFPPYFMQPPVIKSSTAQNLGGLNTQEFSLFEPEKHEKPKEKGDIFLDSYGDVQVDTSIVNTITRQLITSSVILCNESKIDLNKWAKNMIPVYERRFGKGENGMKIFHEWADMYSEFLTWNIKDNILTKAGYDKTDIQAIYVSKIIDNLASLPSNPYIEIYIEELSKYLIE